MDRTLSILTTLAITQLFVIVPGQDPVSKGSAVQAPVATDADGQRNWAQFRGPGARGIAVGSQPLPVEFGPRRGLVFRTELPPGHSSPCIWGDKIFLTGAQDRVLHTICLDRATGKQVWRREIETPKLERVHRINSSASPTPAADAEYVFVYFGSFGLVCYTHAGKEVWRRELKSARNIFGTATSCILQGEHLIFNRDTNEESFLELIERKTGRVVRKTDRTGFPSGWSTPVIRSLDGLDELIVYGAFHLTAYDLKSGEERWSVPGLADEPCITPVMGDGLVFVSSYNMRTNPEVIGLPKFDELLKLYDQDDNQRLTRAEVASNKSILSRVDADGEGDHPLRGFFRFLDKNRDGELIAEEWQKMFRWLGSFKQANALIAIRPGDGDKRGAEIAWQYSEGVPECPSPLYYEGRIYLIKNGGIATCLDAKSGEMKFQGRIGARGPCYASPLAGDGKIYAASARGVITVLQAADELKVLARNDLGERIMATPALLDGRIYVRTEKHLFAFAVK